jgi:hypothetical protein
MLKSLKERFFTRIDSKNEREETKTEIISEANEILGRYSDANLFLKFYKLCEYSGFDYMHVLLNVQHADTFEDLGGDFEIKDLKQLISSSGLFGENGISYTDDLHQLVELCREYNNGNNLYKQTYTK